MKWLPGNANQRARRLTDPYHVIPKQKLVFSVYLTFIVRLELQNQSLFQDDLSGLFSGQLCAHVLTLSIVPASIGGEGSMSQFLLGMCRQLSNFVANLRPHLKCGYRVSSPSCISRIPSLHFRSSEKLNVIQVISLKM